MLYTTEYPYVCTNNIYETDNIKLTVNGDVYRGSILSILRYNTDTHVRNGGNNIEYEFKTQTIIPKVVHFRNNYTCSNNKISVYGYNKDTDIWELLCEDTTNTGIGWGPYQTNIIIDINKTYNKIKITDSTTYNLCQLSYCILDYEPVTGRMIKNQVKNTIMQNELLKKITIPYNAE